jgi:hypothetical protein
MPGFQIGTAVNQNDRHRPLGLKALSETVYLYQYFWEVNEIFGETKEQARVGIRDVNLPDISFEIETAKGANIDYKFASRVKFSDLSFTFYDTLDLCSYLVDWRNLIWNYTDGIKLATNYKKTTKISVHHPFETNEDSNIVVQEYLFEGSWPSSIKYGKLTYTASDCKFVDVTITYDGMVLRKIN